MHAAEAALAEATAAAHATAAEQTVLTALAQQVRGETGGAEETWRGKFRGLHFTLRGGGRSVLENQSGAWREVRRPGRRGARACSLE
eukprot:7984827-Pyramimonas_sp.AAC.1